jgi:glycerol-3-phosphate dehydrogenase
MIPKTDDGRVLFAVPWQDKVILGTTDTPIEKVDLEPHIKKAEVEYIVNHFNRYIERKISISDIKSVFVGVRPLAGYNKLGVKKTSSLSRDYIIFVSKSGLITITGGKWTNYRKMAEDVVNRAILIGNLNFSRCISTTLSLDTSAMSKYRRDDIYFSSKKNQSFIHNSLKITNADISYYVKYEFACNVEDVLARRTGLLFRDAKIAGECIEHIASIMKFELKQNDEWQTNQIINCRKLLKNILFSYS